MMICSLIFAYVVGTMCSLVQGLDVTNLEFQAMMDDINEYMKKHKVPRELRLRVRKYCLYQRDSINHHNEEDLLNFFSPALRKEVALHNYLPILEKVAYFAHTPTSFLTELALNINLNVFGPNEVITDSSARVGSMYILMKGRAQIERTDKLGMVYIAKELDRGSVFGEEALLFGGCGSDSIRTLTFCDVCILAKSKFDDIISSFPIVHQRVKSIYARKKWKEVLTNPDFGNELKKLRKLIDSGCNPIHNVHYNPCVNNTLVATEVNGGLMHLRKDFNLIVDRVDATANKCRKMEKDIQQIGENINKIMQMLQQK